METVRYKIVFDGLTALEIPEETVKANLAQLFKCDLSRIEPLFNGQLSTLKRGLDEAQATQYVQTLRKAGAMARMEREQVEAQAAAAPQPIALSLVEEPELERRDAARQAETISPAFGSGNGASPQAPMGTRGATSGTRQQHGARQSPYKSPTQELGHHQTIYCDLPIVSTNGRLGRMRFMAWNMVLGLFGVILILFMTKAIEPNSKAILVFFVMSFVVWFGISLSFIVRRLHDMNMSGWWVSIMVVLNIVIAYNMQPDSVNLSSYVNGMMVFFLAQFLFWAFLCIKPGDAGENDYDHPSPPNNAGVILLAGMFIFGSVISSIGMVTQFTRIAAVLSARNAAQNDGGTEAQMQEFERLLEQDPEIQRQMREHPEETRRRIEELKAQMRQALEKQNQSQKR
jgi:uncharacterized membrane protein YhaH (DUF805 family)